MSLQTENVDMMSVQRGEESTIKAQLSLFLYHKRRFYGNETQNLCSKVQNEVAYMKF